jgi:hypothetical protein
MKRRILFIVGFALVLSLPCFIQAADPASQFRNPPDSAKPLTWWHWLDGNITKEGITGDWESMKRAGLGGAYLFNCGVGMPQGPVRFMQPDWLDMMDHTVREADRLGLKFGIHNCDGFSQSGGPWIRPETSMKELTWTVREVTGPVPVDALLEKPENKESFYQDIAVVAFPVPSGDSLTGPGSPVQLRGSLSGTELAKLTDGKADTKVVFPVPSGSNYVDFVFPQPRTVRSVVCRGASPHNWEEDFPIHIEVSADGTHFKRVGTFTANWDMRQGVGVTAACEDAIGKVFRLSFSNPWAATFSEIELSEAAHLHFAEAKAGLLRSRGHGSESRHHKAYPGPDRQRPLAPELLIPQSSVQNLTATMDSEGRLKWKAPAGRWRIIRLGYTSNGHRVAPATPEGRGLECDKLNSDVIRFHLEQYVGKLKERAGKVANNTLVAMEVDSWECGIQNWTAGFEKRFRDRLGYDLLKFLPTLLEGWIVDNADVSERAMWDWRRFLADQFSEQYFSEVARFAKKKGLTYVGESTGRQQYLYDVSYIRNSEVTMGEFWLNTGPGQGVRVDNKVASSIAHIVGHKVVASESYTSGGAEAGWNNHPFTLKALGDKAFCAGINQFVFHTFAHQPYASKGPGFTFASWGLNFNRGNTWWETGNPAWMAYLTRCNHLLRQGKSSADVLAFVGEDVPNRIAWRDELKPVLPAGYDFDGCDAKAILDARVKKGHIVLPSGTEYRVLLLPPLPTMRPAVMKKLHELVADGALVLGSKPMQSPSLPDLGKGDVTLRKLADDLWGTSTAQEPTEHVCGKGRVFSNMTFEDLFKRIGLSPDFDYHTSTTEPEILYTHRRDGEMDIYFLSNQNNRFEEINAAFRVGSRTPELWDPATGNITRPGVFKADGDRTHLPIRMEPFGSVFVVFRSPAPVQHGVSVAADNQTKKSTTPAASLTPPGLESAQVNFTWSLWVKPADNTPLPEERKVAVAFQGQNWAVFAQPGHTQFGEGHAGVGIGVGRNGVCVLEHSARYAPAVITYPGALMNWTHLALVYANGVPTLYVNGKEARKGTKGPFVAHAVSPKTGKKSGPKFRGETTEPLLFDRALKPSEIANLASSRTGTTAPALPAFELERDNHGQLFARFWQPEAQTIVMSDGKEVRLSASVPPREVSVTGSWQVRFPEGLGAPASAQFEKLVSWPEHSAAGIRYFSGTATYEKDLEIPAELFSANRELYLDLGEVAVIAAVKLNGHDLGILWKPPFRARLDGIAKPGVNRLEVRVTNLWPNRMIGDSTLPDDVPWNRTRPRGAYPAKWPDWLAQGTPRTSGRISFCSRKEVYSQDDPLLASGLLGPVTLRLATCEFVKAKP